MSKTLQTRFGRMAVDPDRVIEFALPLLGLERSRRFLLVEIPESRPFVWLQSVDEPDVALPLADPWRFFPAYRVEISQALLEPLGLVGEGEVAVYCVVSRGNRGLGMNLAAPVLLHHQARRGGQVVLDDSRYQPYHPMEPPEVAFARGA